MHEQLRWKKYHPLSDQNAFICLVNWMGNDSSIVQAARVSYDKDNNPITANEAINSNYARFQDYEEQQRRDRNLIRYLMNHQHTTPFEMVEVQFMVQVPMDCWRQWVRHRTANINEYSTRYTEALDFFQVTQPDEWRLQSTDNKQGSSGFLNTIDGEMLSQVEHHFHNQCKAMYNDRLALGIAKEQARKDLPLSTYTRAYWKCDLHNIFNFLRLRMDSHAQLEIRSFANCMFEIVKQLFPVACEAFEDYVLHAKKFSRMEMEVIKELLKPCGNTCPNLINPNDKPSSMTEREWKEFLAKLGT